MKRYQAVAFLLSTAMTVTSVAPVFGAASDINGHWAQATIAKWQDAGRIGGYEDGTFKPDKTITRAEFVRLLNSATSTSFTSSASVNFSDVKESDWFYADVAKAVGAKITSGFEDGTFRPGETVTRMQAAVFICNAKGLAANEAGANLLTDAAQIPAWAKGAVGAVISAGYMSGYPDGSFGGSKGMTRAEAVSTLDRVLGGGVTTPAPDNQGVSTPSTDNEDTTIAEAKQEGNMVWRSGGGGGSSRGSSSSNGGSSSSDKDDNDIVTKDTTISNQRDADKLKGKTVFGDVTINLNSDLDLENVKFKGDVKVNSGTVAAAYIGDDTAVAAASSFKWTITLVGTTSFDGNVTVTSESTSAPLVEIVTRTRKSINSFIARAAARIVGFDTVKVQASAPVKVADGKVENITAEKDAEITLEKDATITKVEVAGDAKVTVEDGASVTNVAVSGSAKAEIEVKGTANVGEVAISGSATATVDVAESAKVDKITSTSSGKTEVTGDGTISKIEATNPDTVDTTGATKAPDVEQIGGSEEKPGDGEEETTEIAKADIAKLQVTAPKAAGEDVKITGLPTGVTAKPVKWTKVTTPDTPETVAEGDTSSESKETVTANVELTPDTGYAFAANVADLTVKDLEECGVTVSDVKGSTTSVTFTATAEVAAEQPNIPQVLKIVTISGDKLVQQGTTLPLTATLKDAADKPFTTKVSVTMSVDKKAGTFVDADGNTVTGEVPLTPDTTGKITLPSFKAAATQADITGVTITASVKADEATTVEGKLEGVTVSTKAVAKLAATTESNFTVKGNTITVPAGTTKDDISADKFTLTYNNGTTDVTVDKSKYKIGVTLDEIAGTGKLTITITDAATAEFTVQEYDIVVEKAEDVTATVTGTPVELVTEAGANQKLTGSATIEVGGAETVVETVTNPTESEIAAVFKADPTSQADPELNPTITIGTGADANKVTVAFTAKAASGEGGSAVKATPNGTYKYEVTIPAANITPKAGYAAAEIKETITVTVTDGSVTETDVSATATPVTFNAGVTGSNTSTVTLIGAKIKTGYNLNTAATADKITVTPSANTNTLEGSVTAEAGKNTFTVAFEEKQASSTRETAGGSGDNASTTPKTETFTVTIPEGALDVDDTHAYPTTAAGLTATITVTLSENGGSEGTPIAATDIGAMSVTATAGTAPTRLTIAKIDDKDVPVNSAITWATKGDTPTPTTELTAGQTYTATVTLAPIGGTNTFAENFSLAGKKVTVNNAEQGTDITVTGESLGLNTEKTKYTFTFDVTVVADPDANKPSVGTFTGKEGTGTESDTVAVTVNGTATNTSTVTLKVVPTNPTVGDKIKFTVAKANANASGDLKNTTEFVGGTNKTLEVAIAEDNKTNVPATLTISGDEELSLTVTAEYLKVTDGIASSLNPKSEESITVNVTNPIIKTVDLSESSILALTVDEELTAPNVTIPSGVLYKETIDGTAKWVTIADNGTATPVDNVGDTDNPAIVLPSTKYGISVTLEANTDASNGGVVGAKFDDTADWTIDKVTPPKDMEVKKATLADGKLTVVFAFTAATDPSEASVASDAKLTMAEGNKNVNDNQEILVTLKGCKVKTGGLTNQDASNWISSDSLTGNWTNVTATGNAGEQTITFTFGTLSSDLSNELSGNNNKIKIAIPKDMLEGSSLTDGSTLDVEVPVALASVADPVE